MGATVLPTGLADAMLGQIPASLYAQAHTGDPGASGTANVAPGAQARGLATLLAASGGQRAWSAPVEVSGITPGTAVSHVSLWSATVGGTFRLAVALDAPVTVPGIVRVTLGPVVLAGETSGLPQGAVAVLGAGGIAVLGARVALGDALVTGAGVVAAAGGPPMPQGAALVEGAGVPATVGVRVGYGAADPTGVGVIAAAGQAVAGDSTAPAITGFTVPSTASSTSITGISASATDAVGVTHYAIKDVAGGASAPTFSAGDKVAITPTTSWSTSSLTATAGGTGTRDFYLCVWDAAGNSTISAKSTCTVSAAQQSLGLPNGDFESAALGSTFIVSASPASVSTTTWNPFISAAGLGTVSRSNTSPIAGTYSGKVVGAFVEDGTSYVGLLGRFTKNALDASTGRLKFSLRPNVASGSVYVAVQILNASNTEIQDSTNQKNSIALYGSAPGSAANTAYRLASPAAGTTYQFDIDLAAFVNSISTWSNASYVVLWFLGTTNWDNDTEPVQFSLDNVVAQ